VTPIGLIMDHDHDGKSAIVALGVANHIAFRRYSNKSVCGYVPVEAVLREKRSIPTKRRFMSYDLSTLSVEAHEGLGGVAGWPRATL